MISAFYVILFISFLVFYFFTYSKAVKILSCFPLEVKWCSLYVVSVSRLNLAWSESPEICTKNVWP